MEIEFLNVCRDVTNTTKKIPKKEYLFNGNFPIYDQGKSDIAGYSNDTDNLASDIPYILFGDHTRIIKFINRRCYIGADGVKLLKVYNKNFDSKYVYYSLLASKIPDLGYQRHYKFLKKTKIILRNLKDQQTIVKILDNISQLLIEETKKISILDELIKSRFNEMFSNLNKVELHEIADIIMGQSPESKYYNFDGEGLPFFQGKADFGDKFTNVRMYTKKWNKKAQKGSILMSVRAPVGPVNFASVDCAIGRGLCAINSKNNISNNEFLYNALAANEKEIALIGSAGTTIKAINKSQVYKILLPDAPIDLQNEFSTFVQQVDKLKFNIQESIKETQLLFDSLMQKYFG